MNISDALSSGLNVQNRALSRPSQDPEIDTRNLKTPEEAAKTFEKVLVEQFVNVMTEQLFKSNLSGDDGPGWMKAYGDTQRRVLTEVLSDHLVDSGTFDISSVVLEQWQRGSSTEED